MIVQMNGATYRLGLGITEPAATLQRRGYYSPKHHPFLSRFASLSAPDRELVAKATVQKGVVAGTTTLYLLSRQNAANQ